jgi:hypothetical protein
MDQIRLAVVDAGFLSTFLIVQLEAWKSMCFLFQKKNMCLVGRVQLPLPTVAAATFRLITIL